jgi:hypothetical protein
MNRALIIFSLLVLASLAQAEVIKTCKSTLQMPDAQKVVPTTFEIVKNGNSLIGKTTQIIDGKSTQLPDEEASITEADIHADLATLKSEDLNEAEGLILGTQNFLKDPEIGKFFSVGLDLKAIRHAKLFQIGKFTHMGGTVIIEAKDENGKDLGSFITGFIPFACNK